jgi:AraC-like DNA-binding protein
MTERTSAATWLKGVAHMFAAQGLDVPALFANARLDIHQLDDPQARYSADDMSVLWELAVAQSGNPRLGLSRDLAARFGNFDLVSHAMVSCPTLLAGLQHLAEAMAVVSNAATFAVAVQGQVCALTLGHLGNRRPVPRQRTEYGLLTILMLCNWLTHRELQPVAVEFEFPPPDSLLPYQQAFQCPLRFAQPATRLLLSLADVAAALPGHNPAILAVHEQLIAQRLQALGDHSLVARVRRQLMSNLHQGEPLRQDIARQLHLSDASLKRHLLAEHTSYLQVLDELRLDLARKYLADPRHSLSQVSALLGFGDESNFFRACKRWFGMPPGAYRRHLFLTESTPSCTTPKQSSSSPSA